ncbi:dihydrofolate reductase family protein [Hymenobacter arizonensis]|uniref:Dihydrofolate reductase n=1 Tax=Hymenobacter arizonensis TaxID=1227077 RepID=A0A1I5ZT40_HYMAR|nr:dihydrofolate reductase family protein [Hymenobacter arizonensis]SFQ59570.1 Dihydrofolate reductase [Hymenobacter arizonensis]
MRKIVVAMYLTLDGIMEEPAWTGPYFNDEVGEFQSEAFYASDALLLGRITYEGFAAAWPKMGGDGGFGDRMNSMPKFVASTTLREMEWNASLLDGDVVAAVTQLKQQPGTNLLIYGSGQLVRTLMAHHLIDEYRLMVHPLVLGSGKRLFVEESRAKLRLVNSRTTSTGVALLTYEPDQA